MGSQQRIAVFGGSFNPPGQHHRDVVEAVAPHFDTVIVVPCGPRPDKTTTNDVDPIHRATMADMALGDIPNVRIELFDLEQDTFTRTHHLDARFSDGDTEVWHVVGTDLVVGGGSGRSVIQRHWRYGEEIWRTLNFAVVMRDGFECPESDLPPRSMILKGGRSGASRDIRTRIFEHRPYAHLVHGRVAGYVERYGLYHGASVGRSVLWEPGECRPIVVADPWSDDARAIAGGIEDMFGRHDDILADPNMIVVVGGDGTMLRTVREHWRRRLPFVGINAGHIGFLLNDTGKTVPDAGFWSRFQVQHVPMLYVQHEPADGGPVQATLAFNEAWVERDVSQAAWLEVSVNGEVRIQKMVADGGLVATATGSTAYARAMGGVPVPASSPTLSLVGSNVMHPHHWRQAVLPLDSEVTFRVLSPGKRPVAAFADGERLGRVTELVVRSSRIAAVELAFRPSRDLAAKLAQLQFPAC